MEQRRISGDLARDTALRDLDDSVTIEAKRLRVADHTAQFKEPLSEFSFGPRSSRQVLALTCIRERALICIMGEGIHAQ